MPTVCIYIQPRLQEMPWRTRDLHGMVPPLQFICLQAFDDCIDRNVGNSRGQDDCKTSIQSRCGTLDPNKAEVSSGSGTTTPSATTGPSASGTTDAPATTSSTNAAPHENFRALANGAAVIAVGLFAFLI